MSGYFSPFPPAAAPAVAPQAGVPGQPAAAMVGGPMAQGWSPVQLNPYGGLRSLPADPMAALRQWQQQQQQAQQQAQKNWTSIGQNLGILPKPATPQAATAAQRQAAPAQPAPLSVAQAQSFWNSLGQHGQPTAGIANAADYRGIASFLATLGQLGGLG